MENTNEQMFNSSEARFVFENIGGGVNPSVKDVGIKFFCEGKDIREIAKEMNFSESTIKSLKQDAQRYLNNKGLNVEEFNKKYPIPKEDEN